MNSLFAGLDAGTFDQPPSSQPSSSQPRPSSSQPKPKRKPAPKPTPVVRPPPQAKPVPPRPAPPNHAAAPPPRPKPFWDTATPAAGQGSSLKKTGGGGGIVRRDAPAVKSTDATAGRAGMLASKSTAAAPKPATARYVEIVVEGKENEGVRAVVDLKGKGKAVVEPVRAGTGGVDVEALLDGMDWDMPMSSQEESRPLPVVRTPTVSCCPFGRAGTTGADWGRVQVPQSKQYTRCRVLEVEEDFSSRKSSKARPAFFVPGATRWEADWCYVCRLSRSRSTASMAHGKSFCTTTGPWLPSRKVCPRAPTRLAIPKPPPSAGDTVNLIGAFVPSATPSLTIDRLSGLLVLHPDILVSSTKVADSSHCARKALLQELIRTTGGATPALSYGNMLHELMQACLTEGKWDKEWRKDKIDEIVMREVQTLWSMELGVDTAREQMLQRSEGFAAFEDLFFRPTPGVRHFPCLCSDDHER